MSAFLTIAAAWTAARLRAWAHRLDPAPTAIRAADGGWIIELSGVPLAHVAPGRVRGRR